MGFRGSKDAVGSMIVGRGRVQELLELIHFNYPHSENEELLLREMKLPCK